MTILPKQLGVLLATAWLGLAMALPVQSQEVPGLGPAGNLAALQFETTSPPTLSGADSRRQLLVTGRYSSGQLHDLTNDVSYAASPAGIVQIDSSGFATPLADGEVTITARAASGQTATLKLSVEQFEVAAPVNFANQIVPIFTKLGCNSGSCHGKSSGQNGFKLSLLGFYPDEDYEYLVKESQGRRVFPSAPEFSLLLTKPMNQIPHGGGKRIDADSLECEMLVRWIEQGMPYGAKEDPVVERIEVLPKSRLMQQGSEQQLAVIAHYSDGSAHDVSRMVKYDSNDTEMADVGAQGRVTTYGVPGEAVVMARFQDQVTVFRAVIPMGLPSSPPPVRNFIDQHVFAKLRQLGIPPSERCDDATFLRRASVDITGLLPTTDQVTAFLADNSPGKRDKLIEQLLSSPAYVDHFANKWNAILRNQRTGASGKTVTTGFHKFVRDSIANNVTYDRFVRTLLTSAGDARNTPQANWFAQVPTPITQAEDVAQLFLGLRIQCAHCHHHPFEKWTQDDYFGLTAFFSRVKVEGGKQKDDKSSIIKHEAGLAKSLNPRTKQDVLPTALEGEPLDIDPATDPRTALVGWMTSPDNPFFARTLVNRYWKHFFGRGLVEPEDDMRVTNPPTNPELLDALAVSFVQSKFDFKQLVRTICQSNAYQLSSLPNEYNGSDKQNYSRYYGKRLAAEVLLDAIDRVADTQTKFKDLPEGTRAMQLPDNSFDTYFLTVFGKPQAASACECERSNDANLAQSLHLLNSPDVQAKLSVKTGRPATLAQQTTRPHEERVTELYYAALTRPPRTDELALIVSHLEKAPNTVQAYEDVLWALINTKEFLFNH